MDSIQEQLNDLYEAAELELNFLMIDLEIKFTDIEAKHETILHYYIYKIPKKNLVDVIIKVYQEEKEKMLHFLEFIKNLK